MNDLFAASDEFWRFIRIGICTTLIHYVVLNILYSGFEVTLAISNAASFLIAVVFSYFANHHYTFRSNRRYLKVLPKFLVVTFLGLVLSVFLLQLLVQDYGMRLWIAFLIVTSIVTVNNFLFTKFWVFVNQ